MDGAHVIEVHDLIILMTNKPKPGCLHVNDEKKAEFPLIRKIKRMPCDAHKDVYEPNVVSIGPYHHRTRATLEMERRKWDSFRYILEWNPNKTMRDYLHAMAGLEQQIRSCYADEVKIDSDELLRLMLLDGCFMLYTLHGIEGVVEPILNFNKPNLDERKIDFEQSVNEPAISIEADASQQISSSNTEYDDSLDNTNYLNQWYTSFSIQDLVLLENQIPFFVIMEIFQLVTDGKTLVPILLENVARFTEDLLQSYPKAILKIDRPKELHHLLHLCHLYFKPNPIHVKINSNISTFFDDEAQSIIAGKQLLGWHHASEYHKARVEFKKRAICIGNPHSLLDISFHDGVMEIPCLTIDPNTHCLFRNLMAFEETCPQFGNYITTYVVFLSQLITMPEDVSLLTKRGIIINQLDGGAAVSNLFSMLAQGVTFDFNGEHYLKHICHAMEIHYQIRRSGWREWLGSIDRLKITWLGS